MHKEDNPKARGWKHHSAKEKHKSKLGGRKTKVKLESNWDRYDQEPSESKVNSSTDFSILANAPIAHGSHFQFKSDKDIAAEISECGKSSKLFNLDLTLLDESLSTIPYNIRNNIDMAYFTENQQRLMTALNDKIGSYMTRYQKLVPDVIFGSQGELSANDDDNNGLVITKPVAKSPGDLEQWLDDILPD